MLSKRQSTVNINSPIQDYVHPDDQTQPTLLLLLLLLLLLCTRSLTNFIPIDIVQLMYYQ